MTDTNYKLVIFGAGKIGRSFIGQVFSTGGYNVVYIDINKAIIDELNSRNSYNVIIKSDKDSVIHVKNVSGVYAGDQHKVISEVASASIVAVSVGQKGLKDIFQRLAKGLIERYRMDRKNALDIIIAENMRKADNYFRSCLIPLMPGEYPFDELVGLVETSIGRMVPIMPKNYVGEDILEVFAEPYDTLILSKNAFKNPIPKIKNISPKENMTAWVDRKIFIHNLGHVSVAYIGFIFNPQFKYIYEALEVTEIYTCVKETMLQSAEILLKKYPGVFTSEELNNHIDDLLYRFQNKALGDTIYRVGSDLMRKLNKEDRLVGAIKSAMDYNLPYDKILFALVCGCHFNANDEFGKKLADDIEFNKQYEEGLVSILTNVCGFNKVRDSKLISESKAIENRIKKFQHKGINKSFC